MAEVTFWKLFLFIRSRIIILIAALNVLGNLREQNVGDHKVGNHWGLFPVEMSRLRRAVHIKTAIYKLDTEQDKCRKLQTEILSGPDLNSESRKKTGQKKHSMDLWSNTISQLFDISVDDSEARCFTQRGLSSRIPTHRNAALQDACFWSTYSILCVRQGPKNTALESVATRF